MKFNGVSIVSNDVVPNVVPNVPKVVANVMPKVDVMATSLVKNDEPDEFDIDADYNEPLIIRRKPEPEPVRKQPAPTPQPEPEKPAEEESSLKPYLGFALAGVGLVLYLLSGGQSGSPNVSAEVSHGLYIPQVTPL